MRHAINVLRLSAIGLLTGAFSIPVALLGVLGNYRASDAATRMWARCLLAIAGVKVRVIGADKIDPARTYVFLANHLSHMDVPAMVAWGPKFPAFVAKKELLRIPLFGWAIAMSGHIVLDRSDREGAYEALERAGRKYTGRRDVFFFPEGTRSREGPMGKFKRGGFVYALASGQPIVPTVIRGGRGILIADTLELHPGTMEIIIDDPIEVKDLKDEDIPRLIARVRAVIESHDPSGLPPPVHAV